MDQIEATFRGDRLIQEFGMELLEAREGYARVSVRAEERFLNSHGVAHGVLLFAVADAAFAVAANAVTESIGVQWSFGVFRSARAGETLIGEARALHQGRRHIVCELSVSGAEGRLLARGQATALPATRESYRNSP